VSAPEAGRPKLMFLVTEDWYFCSHRLPVARAARAAGFAVFVASRVAAHAPAIEAEGFALRPLAWRRRGDGLIGGLRAILAIVCLYRAERPDIVHHVALKPALFGGLASRLAFPRRRSRPAQIDAIMGLGSGLSRATLAGRLRRAVFGPALRLLAGRIIVQNPEDRAEVARFGIPETRITLIRGSGVDAGHFRPLHEPGGAEVTVALVGRMLRAKGVLDAAAAVRQLRAQGLEVALLLAGAADPDNPGSLDATALKALAAEPGIEWLGQVADVRTVWQRAAIAVLASSYGEGLPKALLEAAACARPLIASDVPGCREIVRHGETGLLVPPHDTAALAEAIAALATDPERRRAMGAAARALVERDFADAIVAQQTLALYRRVLEERRE
jgi:glycosyltransferase involved in cell wall biosynthesis